MADAAPPPPAKRCGAIPTNPALIAQARMVRTWKRGGVEIQIHVDGSSPKGRDLDLAPQLPWQPLEERVFVRRGEDKAFLRGRGREGARADLGKNWRVVGTGWLRRPGAGVAGAADFVQKPFLELRHVCVVARLTR